MPEYSPEERRVRHRQRTNRGAACYDPASGLVVHGRVTDISTAGLQLRLGAPVAAGTRWELEVGPRHARPEDPPILVRGEIVWCAGRRDGSHAVGVRLHMPLEATGTVDFFDARDIANRVTAFQDALVTLRDPGDLMPLGKPDPEEGVGRTRRPRRRHAWLLLLLLLLAVLAAAGVWRSRARPEETRTASPHEPVRSVRVGQAPAPLPEEDDALASAATSAGRLAALDHAYHLFLQGETRGIEDALATLAQARDLTPVERFLVQSARAQLSYALGDLTVGIVAMREALEMAPPELPAPWRAAGEEMLDELPRHAAGVAPLWGLHRAADFVSLADSDGKDLEKGEATEADMLRLEVDLSDFVLRVVEEGRVTAILPVGVGAMGKTPVGDFVIANKLRDPTWFNAGDPVPPGDPENPIGASWMGLGQGGRPLPYGLHPTEDGGSIGAAESAGCIRLRPRDAARLFATCPLGTLVRIVP